jgi:hypothetical protein
MIVIISLYKSGCTYVGPEKDNPLVYEVESWNLADLQKDKPNQKENSETLEMSLEARNAGWND